MYFTVFKQFPGSLRFIFCKDPVYVPAPCPTTQNRSKKKSSIFFKNKFYFKNILENRHILFK